MQKINNSEKTIDTRRVFGCEVENIQMRDYPDFCDAYISKAYYQNGRGSRELTEEELELLNEDRGFVYEKTIEWLF